MEFIDRELAKDTAHRGDPRIVRDLEQSTVALVEVSKARLAVLRIDHRGSQLRQRKSSPSRPTRVWLKSTGPRVEADRNGRDKNDRE